MKSNKIVLVIIATSVILVAFIGSAFYYTLESDNQQENIAEAYPQKEVMILAKAMQTARLDDLAKKGKVDVGMDMNQIRLAKGEPVRVETIDSESGNPETIWWYRHEGWMSVVFNSEGSVSKIEYQH